MRPDSRRVQLQESLMEARGVKGRRPYPGRLGYSDVLIVALSVIHLILLRFSSSIPSHGFLFSFYFLYIVLLPGYILSAGILGRAGVPLRALLSLVMGTAHLFLILILFSVFHWDIYYIGIVVPVIVMLLTLLRGRGVLPPRTERHYTADATARTSPLTGSLLALLLVTAAALVLRTGDPLFYTSDSADNIAYIRTVSRSHEAFPDRYIYRDGGSLTRDIRKGLGHSMWGTLNALTGRRDALAVWPVISAVGSVFVILSLFCAGALFFRSPALGLTAALLFTLYYHGGLGGYQLITIAYAFPFGKIFYFTLLPFIILYLVKGGKEFLIIAASACLAATGTHIGHFIIGLYIVVVFSAVRLLGAGREEGAAEVISRAASLSAVMIMVCAPYLLLRYIRDYAPANEIHTHVQGIFSFTDRLYMLNPMVFYKSEVPVLPIMVFLSLFILWRSSSRVGNLRFLLWGTIGTYAVMYNPFLYPFAASRISYLIMRFESAVPSVLIVAYLLKELWRKLRRRESAVPRWGTVIGFAAVAGLLLPPLLRLPSDFAYSKKRLALSKESSCRNLEDLYEVIGEKLPDGGVVASDPVTSYCIPAFTDQFVACTYDQHSTPNDSTALQRIQDCRDIYLGGIPVGRVVEVLEKYDVGYLVFNGRIPRSVVTMYWRPERRTAREAAARLSSLPELFETIYEGESLTLMRFNPAGEFAEEPGARPDRWSRTGEAVSAQEASYFTKSGMPGILIKGISTSRGTVARGDTLGITIEWVGTGERQSGRHSTVIRFDTDFAKGPLYAFWYGKIYRKILERIRRMRFRFSSGHIPLNGMYPPDRWPPLRVVEDAATVVVPKDAAPGEYLIRVKLVPKTQYPNYTLGDLFTDEDIYSGEILGRVSIE